MEDDNHERRLKIQEYLLQSDIVRGLEERKEQIERVLIAGVAPLKPREYRPAIPLREAQLCVDCETVYQGSECPSCTSTHGFAVARVIAPRDPGQTPWRKGTT